MKAGGGGGRGDGGDRDAEECGDASSLIVELLAWLTVVSTESADTFIVETAIGDLSGTDE